MTNWWITVSTQAIVTAWRGLTKWYQTSLNALPSTLQTSRRIRISTNIRAWPQRNRLIIPIPITTWRVGRGREISDRVTQSRCWDVWQHLTLRHVGNCRVLWQMNKTKLSMKMSFSVKRYPNFKIARFVKLQLIFVSNILRLTRAVIEILDNHVITLELPCCKSCALHTILSTSSIVLLIGLDRLYCHHSTLRILSKSVKWESRRARWMPIYGAYQWEFLALMATMVSNSGHLFDPRQKRDSAALISSSKVIRFCQANRVRSLAIRPDVVWQR